MIEFLITILVETGILRADLKHHKRVKKREQEDGRKRSFLKYLLTPSMVAFYLLTGFALLVSAFIFSGDDKRKIKGTLIEMKEIEENVEDWKNFHGHYPSELSALTIGRPLRKEWLTDEWGQPYDYELSGKKKIFILKSSGPDKILGNSDDLEIK
jgi:general secretion pathway protein G